MIAVEPHAPEHLFACEEQQIAQFVLVFSGSTERLKILRDIVAKSHSRILRTTLERIEAALGEPEVSHG